MCKHTYHEYTQYAITVRVKIPSVFRKLSVATSLNHSLRLALVCWNISINTCLKQAVQRSEVSASWTLGRSRMPHREQGTCT